MTSVIESLSDRGHIAQVSMHSNFVVSGPKSEIINVIRRVLFVLLTSSTFSAWIDTMLRNELLSSGGLPHAH